MSNKNVIQYICMSFFILIIFLSIMIYKIDLDDYFDQLDELNEFCRCKFKTIQRIINGQVKDNNFIPWSVSIAHFDRHICMGLIVNQYYILTAQHCFLNNTDNLFVRVGLFELFDPRISEKTYFVKQVYRFPNFKYANSLFGGDLAIIKLRNRIKFEDGLIEPACLDLESLFDRFENGSESLESSNKLNETKRTYLTSGFGTKEPVYSQNGKLTTNIAPSIVLKSTNLTENFELFKSDIRLMPLFDLFFSLDLVDVNSTDSPCHGDSGNALNFEREDGLVVVKGISSTSIPIKINETTVQFCKSQSIYTRLSHQQYRSFIKDTVGDLRCRADFIKFYQMNNDQVIV